MFRGSELVILCCIGVISLGASRVVHADAIDGNWCDPQGRSFSINGPHIITPAGSALEGDYSRHAFAYITPPGEETAGTTVRMQLLNEETVRILSGLAPEIWRRCDVTS
jgi:cellulase/cellobiase CelA1